MRHFCESYNLKSLIKVPTCCKNPEIPSCIDLILSNKPRNFQKSRAIETSLSVFDKMMATALRMQFRKIKPRVNTLGFILRNCILKAVAISNKLGSNNILGSSNKFLKHKTDESSKAFVKQCNYCVSLLRRSKRNYYSNLNVKDILTIRNSGKL